MSQKICVKEEKESDTSESEQEGMSFTHEVMVETIEEEEFGAPDFMGFLEIEIIEHNEPTSPAPAQARRGGKFPCDVCGKRVTSRRALVLHKRTHTGERRFQCDQCDKRFTRNENLVRHKRLHKQEKPPPPGHRPYSCELCEKRFTTQNNLTKHKRVHSGYKPYRCEVCKKEFSRKEHLVRHEGIHVGLTEKFIATD